MTLTGYQIKEKIYEGRNSLVYRGQREVEPRSVVLKMLREEYPSPKKLAAFRREYRLLSVLQLPGVIRAYELITDQHRPVMVLEDFGGESLAQLLQNGHLPFATCLPLAIQIVDIVGQVHQQQIIHKDINPANFVLNRQTGQLKLIDFGIAAQLSRENPSFQSPTGLEGTLAYISPEQTGRMNRLVDYRTDFYSLGITLYELLTGRVPFLGTDALTLVHAHIAQQPTPPHEVVPEIPPPLSLIVMKLLAKNAEDRYQSAASLRSDLAACLRQWEMTKTITLFPVGQYEITQRLQIPQKLYGREQDCSILYDAFTRVSQGASELLLISGPAGIGKTTLVQEVYKALIHQRGYFIAGKFDQLQRSIPYGSLVQAFRALIRQILTESEERVTAWRNALLTTVGVNLQVVIDVIPEVELLVGPQPSAPPLPPAETQSRFRLTFQSFFRVFLSSDHPLVLFLDDLQWADSSSLSLLQLFLTVPENRYLFVICAYRDNEVPAGHRVQVTLDEIRKEGGAVSQIILGPLSLSATQQLISDTLHSPLATVRSLAELVVAKTAGNPFFINEFLKSLDRVGLLTFAVEERQWQWNVVQIRARNITDNVVELMSDRMQDLGGETQATLELAACLGNQFDLQTLATVSEKSPLESAAALWPALSEGLILPLDETYRLVEFYDTGLPEGGVVEYKFAHDRIQQAAYALIPETQKQAIHQRIGQLLLQQIPPEGREQQIFTIVNQLNAARGRIQQPTEQNELVTLNLQAGRKAKAAAAYGPAFTYLQVGLSLLTTETWQQHYELALALHVEAAEVSYLCGDFEQMEHLIDSVCRHAQTLLDTVKAYEVRLAAYSVQNRQQEGIQTGLQILKLLQIQLPEKPGYEEIFQELGETQRVMAETPVEYLRDLPVMTDPHRVAAIRILFNLTHHVYTSAPELFPFIVFRIVTLSARYGNTRYSAFGYATYGLILCGQVGDIDRGYQFGQLAQRLVEQEERKAEKSSTLFVVNSFIRHWKEHIRETLKPLLEAYQTGLETGDLSIGTQAAFVYGFQSYWMGKELGTLEQELEQYSVAFAHLKQESMLNLNRLYQQAVANLMGRSEHPCRLVGSYYDEERMRSVLSASQNVNALAQINLHKVFLCYLFLDYRQCLALTEPTEQYLASLVGASAIPAFHLYDSLVRLAVAVDAKGEPHKHMLEKVAANQEKMRVWAHHAPMNFLHKFYLVEAERARVFHADRDAREYYDQAIDLAQEHGYIHEEALANELAARFYLAREQTRLAQYYLREAHYAYTRWGAVAKVKDLEARYPQLLASSVPDFSPSIASTLSTNTGHRLSSTFDFTSLLRASQAISREIVLDQLLIRLMKIVIENVGAQRGILLLEREGRLAIEAEGEGDQDEITVLQSVPVETSTNLPIAIIHYVERTHEPVVLSDATQDSVFANDPYIVGQRPKSVLCVPLLKQGALSGIVYLENNLTSGAFTPDRLELVTLLSAEAATAIENARLYRNLEETKEQLADYSRTLEQKVAERTQELEEKNRALESANQQVLEANQRKSQFLAGMSHQLRTPMNAILGFTRLVLRRAGDVLPERQRENLMKVQESGENLLVLINDLLDISKIEAGRMEVYPSSFHIQSFVQECCDTMLPLIKPGVQLRHVVANEAGDAYTDVQGLRQILLNLLSNAIKFTDVGEVVVRAQVTRADSNETFLAIAVSDTGTGIPSDALSNIFEEFQQVGVSVQKQEGTGLGLPIARKWAELLGGTLTVESLLGKGSTFTVTVPVIYQQQRQEIPLESVRL